MKPKNIMYQPVDPYGVIIGLCLILAWFACLSVLLKWDFNYANPLVYIGIAIQTHLYTGLFITAHDAMHGSVSRHKGLNRKIGWITSLLFAYNFYDKLIIEHHKHHRFVASDKDPDYHESGNLFIWYWNFIRKYTTLKQLVLMTITLQVLRYIFPLENLLLFWILPGILSTSQLFYFGTYIPHRHGHKLTNKHKSKSLKKNHFWAFVSCYFFGYHYEHHDAPGVPWWRLWQTKH
ncbi:fatty acid desaturase [Seonamhaeicola sp.]|uniref:fatty acid desaturase n=1 Tax=Seonamhaeicola sp. TaxID=1912245 RepID=UPI002626E0F3|nr:fatty acid desaturase [Seonamhaeicola sp.]